MSYPLTENEITAAHMANLISSAQRLRADIESGQIDRFIGIGINEFGEPVIYGNHPSDSPGRLQMIGAIEVVAQRMRQVIKIGRSE